MAEKVTLGLIAMIALDLIDILLFHLLQHPPSPLSSNQKHQEAEFVGTQIEGSPEARSRRRSRTFAPILFAQAKGVAGLGKAGGDGQGGSDKAGQQVPPEVYNALTYAGTAFLLTLSVPLILYGLNKLFNRIQDCFGCGPSSRRKALEACKLKKQQSFEQPPHQQHLQPQPHHHQQQHQQPSKQLQKQSQYHQQHSAKLQSQILDPSSLMMRGKDRIGNHCNNNNENNINSSILPTQHQQSTIANNSPNSLLLNLPPDFELNHKSTQHQEPRQPYIISSPHL